MKKKSLALRYASYIFAIFMFLAVIISIINCIFIYRNENIRLNRQLKHFVDSHLRTAVRELWLTDYEEVRRQLDYISEFNYISFVEITDDEGGRFVAGEYIPGIRLVFENTLQYEYKGLGVDIGYIKIYTDDAIVSETVKQEFVRLFILLAGSSLVIVLMISVLFNLMLGRHIISLSSFLLKEHDELVKTDFVLDRNYRKNDELSELAESINKMRHNIRSHDANEKALKQSLERENQFKGKLFSILSHDLRSPLNSFTGLTESLIMDFDSLSRDSFLAILKELNKSSSALSMLVENLLEWSNLEDVNSEYNPDHFVINSLFSEITDLFSRMVADKSIELVIRTAEQLRIFGDAEMIATVLRNVISNAIKFTPRGGRIEISAERVSESVVITISDNGLGMTGEQIGSVLGNGQTGSTRGTENEKGTGLGFILCNEFVRVNKGTIDIKSELGIGTSVVISLPS